MGCLRKLKAESVDVPVQEEKLGFNTVLYNNVNVPERNIVDTMRDKTREDITEGKLNKNRKEKKPFNPKIINKPFQKIKHFSVSFQRFFGKINIIFQRF